MYNLVHLSRMSRYASESRIALRSRHLQTTAADGLQNIQNINIMKNQHEYHFPIFLKYLKSSHWNLWWIQKFPVVLPESSHPSSHLANKNFLQVRSQHLSIPQVFIQSVQQMSVSRTPKNHVKWSQWMFMNMATMDYGPDFFFHFLTRLITSIYWLIYRKNPATITNMIWGKCSCQWVRPQRNGLLRTAESLKNKPLPQVHHIFDGRCIRAPELQNHLAV